MIIMIPGSSNSINFGEIEHRSLQHIDTDDKSTSNENSNPIGVPLDSRPYFDMSVSKNVTALVGKTAHLNCRVHNLGNKTVSTKHFNFIVSVVVVYLKKDENFLH